MLVRTNGWCECLVQRGAERWVGHGLDLDDALADAIGRMLPSQLGRALLARHVAAPAASADGEIAHAAKEPEPTIAADDATSVSEAAAAMAAAPAETITIGESPSFDQAAPGTNAGEPLQLQTEPIAGSPEMVVALNDAPVASAAPEVAAPPPAAPTPAPAAAAPVVAAPVAPPPPREREEVMERPARPRTSEALDAVEKLLAGIEDRLGPLARMCADRQRLNMLVWICRARAVEESLPGVRDVEHAVARVARRLTEIGKMFWPGSVRALQLSARPADVRREMHANWASDPTNWVEATALAERLLAEHLQKSVDAGYDEDGWADGAARTPRPADPDALFEEVDAELKAILIPPGEVPNGRLGELTSAELEALITAARKLRWLRGAVKDDQNWGIAMGRLRRSLPSLGERVARVREVLDNRHKPSQPWAKLLGEREAEAPDSSVTESPAKLLADLPGAGESKEALMAWLIRAFDVLNTPDLVSKLGPLKAQIATFTEEELNHSDRRVRRRLRDMVKRIAEVEAAPPPKEAKEPEPEPEEQAADEPLAASALDALGARVRAQTKGSRALFVSNREDPELGARLSEMLGISITWCDGSLRRVQAQCERIARGSYDLVLSATGFQVHGVDSALARASSAAGIPYVRVNRGRPVACVQAIAREFGLMSQTIAVPVQAKASC